MGNGNRRHPLVKKLSSKHVFMNQHDNDDMETKVDRIVGGAAYEECMSMFVQSKLVKRKDIAQVSWDDINTDPKLLGKGSYCHVFKASINTSSDERWYIPNCEATFAVKCLNPQVRNNRKDYQTGAIDLAVEGELLSRLDHPNLIKLHGVSHHSTETAYVETKRGYFLVLDILKETLKNRLCQLRTQYPSSSSPLLISSPSSSSLYTDVLDSVGPIAIGVAEGLNYLHSKGVVLRDLKPDNIGFSHDDTPKIFDLGFAREVHTLPPNEKAGSYRYMAPEVGQRKDGGASFHSDVYSFGVLLWELCTLRMPYQHIKTCNEFVEKVMMGGWRERTTDIPSPVLRDLIEQCWDTDPTKRPTMITVLKVLKDDDMLTTRSRTCPRNVKKMLVRPTLDPNRDDVSDITTLHLWREDGYHSSNSSFASFT